MPEVLKRSDTIDDIESDSRFAAVRLIIAPRRRRLKSQNDSKHRNAPKRKRNPSKTKKH